MKLLSFNIFDLMKKVKRKDVLPMIVFNSITAMRLSPLFSQQKMLRFIDNITQEYKPEVQYHNDLHGADVMQMVFFMLTSGGLEKQLNLNKLDCLSFLIAAVCHDLGHDGYTNGYHVNTFTDRAITSNDISVQETYHVSKMFEILKRDGCNFADKFTKDEFKIFRMRVIGLILATDMAKHMTDMSELNAMIDQHQIKKGENVNALINVDDDKKVFRNQQFVMEMCLHASDVS